MRSDKGLLVEENKTWAQIALEKLTQFFFDTILSINPSQLSSYSSLFSVHQLVVDKEELEVAGPLRGLLSVHIQFPKEDLLVLACDMPNMNREVLKELLDSQKHFADFEAYVFQSNGAAEPLCGIYTSKGLMKIHEDLKEKNVQQHSMKYILDKLNTKYLPIREQSLDSFRNLNSPADRK